MTDTTVNGDAETTKPAVSMRKGAAAGRPTRPPRRPPVENITPPRSIDYATLAMGAIVVVMIVRSFLFLGNGKMLMTWLATQDATSNKPTAFFDTAKALHQLRTSNFINAAIVGVALVLLGWAMRRTRSASASRWAMLIVFFFTGLPFYFNLTGAGGLPALTVATGYAVSALSIGIVFLVFVVPASQRYFKACREANIPEELRGQPRPGLSSLFGPKRPRAGAAPATKAAPPARPSGTGGRAKAKVRSDSDAVARGADLARSRAKASKSRKSAG